MLNLRGVKARPHDLEEMLALRPALVELHCTANDLNWTPTKKYDVPLALHVPEYADGELLDPASPDESKRRRAADLYAHAVVACHRVGSSFTGKPRVVFHPGGQTPDEAPGAPDRDGRFAALGRTVEAMKALAGNDVDLLVENLPGQCWFNGGGAWKATFMTSGRDLADFCTWHGLGATLDLCHLHLTDHDKLAEIAAALPFVRHVHYSDARMREGARLVYEEGLQIGQGDMPLEAYFRALAPLAAPSAPPVYAVPEVWYGHEDGGAGFVKAWDEIGRRLVPTPVLRG